MHTEMTASFSLTTAFSSQSVNGQIVILSTFDTRFFLLSGSKSVYRNIHNGSILNRERDRERERDTL